MNAQQTTTAARKRLLLVEDNPLFLEQISLAINDLPDPWDVVSCPTGKKAMATVQRHFSGEAAHSIWHWSIWVCRT